VDRLRRTLDIPLILVTHALEDVVRLASHLLILARGAAVANGPVQTLMSQPELSGLREVIGLGSLFEATVTRVDALRGLVELTFDGGTLLAPGRSLAVDTRVRLRIPAREVILATRKPEGLSLHNALAGVVSSVHEDPHSDHVIVQIAVGRVLVLAEVTTDAASNLGIVVGTPLYALIKSVSLDVLTTGVAAVETAVGPR
jgi:molybdate transport system ATP-binding protein